MLTQLNVIRRPDGRYTYEALAARFRLREDCRMSPAPQSGSGEELDRLRGWIGAKLALNDDLWATLKISEA